AACPLPLQAVTEVHPTLSPLSAGSPPRSWHVYVLCSLLCSPVRSAGVACPYSSSPFLACVHSALPALQSGPICCMSAVSGHPLYCVPVVSGPLLYCVRSLWSSPVLCPQSLVLSCTVSAVSGPLLYCVRRLWSPPVCVRSLWSPPVAVRSLWSPPVRCPQSLVLSCTVSAVSGHLLYCVRSLWSSPVLLYYVCSLWSFSVLCLQSIGSEYIFPLVFRL
ncbi:unnamed protein product, partial [Staurois parvus]